MTPDATPLAAFRVLTEVEKDTLQRDGRFAGSADDLRDGYIHLSTAAQLSATVAKHFAGQQDLWVAEVDLAALAGAIRWEPARDGQDFPHLYGALPLDAIVAYSPLEREEDGTVRPPVTG